MSDKITCVSRDNRNFFLLTLVLWTFLSGGCGPQPNPSDSLFGYPFPPSMNSTMTPRPDITPTPPDSSRPQPTPTSVAIPTWGQFSVPTPSPEPASVRLEASPDPASPLSWQFQVVVSPDSAVRLWCNSTPNGVDDPETHFMASPVSSSHLLTLRGLRAATLYVCRADAIDSDGTIVAQSDDVVIKTAPLPDGLVEPAITVPHSPVSDVGYTLYNYATRIDSSDYEDQFLVIIDASGHVRWYYVGPGGGSVDASYLGNNRVLFGGYAGAEFIPTIVGLDWNLQFVDSSREEEPTSWVGQYHHDVGLSADASSIFALIHTVVDDTFKGFEVRQIDFNSNIVWTWSSEFDGMDTGGLPPNDDGEWDPFHANAIYDRWENGHLFVYLGLRNTNSVYKIDYDSKAVVWTLGVDGDFQLLEQDGTPAEDSRWFFNQHDAKIIGNQVLVYDNGTERRAYGAPFDYSRALQLELDDVAMTAKITFEYDEIDEGWVEPSWGSIDKLPNGNFLIGMGHCWDCSSSDHKSALVELTSDGQPYWRADFPNETDAFYRAFPIDGCDIFNNLTYCPEMAPEGARVAPVSPAPAAEGAD